MSSFAPYFRTQAPKPYSSVQSLSHVRLFATPWTAAHQASLSIQLPELAQTNVCLVIDALQLSHPLKGITEDENHTDLDQNHGLTFCCACVC